MKRIITLFLVTILFLSFIFLQTNAQNPLLSITFTTITPGGYFSPNHILAVWTETESGDFVKTHLVYANARKQHLYTWNTEPANGNEVDAVTGATQTSHRTYTVTWDCRDLDQNIIPDGNYVLHIEMADTHSQGPLAEIDFTITENVFTLEPPDETNFTDISLVYNPDISSIESLKTEKELLKIYPNPATNFVNFGFTLDKDEIINIEIYDEKFVLLDKIVSNKSFYRGQNIVSYNINKEISDGTYFVLFSTNKHIWFGEKLIISK